MHTPEAHERAIKDRLEALRTERGITKQAAYNAAGISRNSYELKIKGGSFSLLEIIRLADFYEVPLDDLVKAA